MKILVLTTLYPPHYIGGYELICEEIVEILNKRGVETRVVCSNYGVAEGLDQKNIFRNLANINTNQNGLENTPGNLIDLDFASIENCREVRDTSTSIV